MTGTEEGYAVQARRASTGAVLWTGKAWSPPLSMAEADVGDYGRKVAEIPGVTAVRQAGREYIVAWGHGVEGKSEIAKGREVVRLAIHRAETSGTGVAPLRKVSVPVTSYGTLTVTDGGAGLLLIRWHGDSGYGAAWVDMASGKVTGCGDECDEAQPVTMTAQGLQGREKRHGGAVTDGRLQAQWEARPGEQAEHTRSVHADGAGDPSGGRPLVTPWKVEPRPYLLSLQDQMASASAAPAMPSPIAEAAQLRAGPNAGRAAARPAAAQAPVGGPPGAVRPQLPSQNRPMAPRPAGPGR
ncbi:hypothetical protein QWM81_12125 [Streptomyces ficellus]|uniref:Uncharacterized protein n=1 Tax=Streptomyces ficellus TaxID=1977088 RepID=A0ABT7Z5K0_9ACTN|nr:hypothetical protein [Streptomyces ficellus]MDN3294784.1 hypothetical protein [Streptomyces ficellus]